MTITTLATEHLRIPLPKPGKVPLLGPKRGSPVVVDLILVHAQTDTGLTGLGLTYVIGPGATAVRQLIDTEFAPLILGHRATDTDRHFAVAEHHARGIGFAGLPARAYAAIDIALWDLKAKQAGIPLAALLGGARPGVPYFLSAAPGTAWTPEEVTKTAKPAVLYGAMGVRVEVGGADVQADADRVRELHDALGEGAWLGVSAGGGYDLATALALAHFFEDQGIDWIEDPIPCEDRTGYARLADRLEIPVAVGSMFDRRGDFTRMLRDGLARVVRPDPCRLGGITPILKVAAVAEAFHAAVSPVRLPEIGVHLGCGLTSVPHVDSVPWFHDVFVGGPVIEGSTLIPGPGPGLGLTLNMSTAEKFRAT